MWIVYPPCVYVEWIWILLVLFSFVECKRVIHNWAPAFKDLPSSSQRSWFFMFSLMHREQTIHIYFCDRSYMYSSVLAIPVRELVFWLAVHCTSMRREQIIYLYFGVDSCMYSSSYSTALLNAVLQEKFQNVFLKMDF